MTRQSAITRTACWVLCLFPAAVWGQLTDAQADGKQIYTQGASASGATLEAVLGEGSTRVPASLMLCASCHGTDGKGRPEGGVVPSEITWDKLSAPIGKTEGLARHRPAYTQTTLERAIVDGIDAGGEPLGSTMPRYPLPQKELGNLLQYLKVLGREISPGLTDTSVRFGMIIPASGPLAASGKSAVALLNAYFQEANTQGGIYGRHLELYVQEAPKAGEQHEPAVESFVREKNIFAMLNVLAPGPGSSMDDAMDVPAIGSFATDSEAETATGLKKFFVLSGLTQQARVLVKFALNHRDEPQPAVAVVYPERMKELAALVVAECKVHSPATITAVQYSGSVPGDRVRTLAAEGAGKVFFLGRGTELEEMLTGAAMLGWYPTVFQPGPLAGTDAFMIPAVFDQRVFLSFPTLPSDADPLAIGEFRALAAKYKLALEQPGVLLPVLASAKILIETLRRSGRQLDRDRFVSTLSSMYDFNTGLTPPITYGATRRIGALGAYIVQLDLKNKTLAQVGSWMVP